MPAIIPTPWTAIELQKYRTKLLRRTKRTMMEYHEVLTFLLEDVLQITDLEGRVHELETEVDNLKSDMNRLKDDEIMHLREINRLQAQRPSSPVMVQANPNMQQGVGFQSPPPPPPQLKSQFPKKYIAQDTGDLKEDYVHEIKQIFTGGMLKPSDVIGTTKPKHLDSEVIEIADDFQVPNITQISFFKAKEGKENE